ncbi:CCR4-NOT transcription complex subunit 4 [Galdieria sulphuraria]|uniref:CCR4-NOT transcription complex subunit 4 n=1 Tax=Galdieria sulphuraria TaxID=130081 RepID=M2Y3V2_GALSU|nr:CCR4-NOT transcription complex subunit 4 [Galdieria sulphuraria]EME30499.1 CCR4-NOT transcription complex subunit 4 [Galdieria sulphuraria]|eukprot:XP_005707019.1 CCR4-NOT transcription complex subunit 4 [Galdieria sulphuraria]
MTQVMEKEWCNSVNCPLCLEELDLTDLSLKPCLCGYQVCLYCLHYIREQQDDKCPACRTPYTEENFSITKLDPEVVSQFSRRGLNKKKERLNIPETDSYSPKTRTTPCSQHRLRNNVNWKRLRIIQKNLICVKGLVSSICRADVLRREELFGRFGKLLRVLVDRGRWTSGGFRESIGTSDIVAIKAMNNEVIYDTKIRVSLATTKYCNAFLESGQPQWCDNPYCLYRHESANSEDVVTADSLQSLGLAPPPPHYLFSMKKFRSHSIPPGYYLPNHRKQHNYEDSQHSFLERNKKLGMSTHSPASSGWSRSLDSDEQLSLDDNSIGNEDECFSEKKKMKNLLYTEENGSLEKRATGNTLEYLSNGNYEKPHSILSDTGELPTLDMSGLLLESVAGMNSPGLDMYHFKNRMSSRFDFHSYNESHDSDDSLSPSDSDKSRTNPTTEWLSDSKAFHEPPTLLENDEWITPEKRLEMMFGNDVVNHFVSLDALPSLNDLLTRLQSSKTKEESTKELVVDKEQRHFNISENDSNLDKTNKENSSIVDAMKEENDRHETETRIVTTNDETEPNKSKSSKKSQRKKRKQKKAKSDSKDSSAASNEANHDSPQVALDHLQSNDKTISSVEYPPNVIIDPLSHPHYPSEEASKDSSDSRNRKESIRMNPTSQTLEMELQLMKEKELQLQKRLEELQTKLEKLLLL